MCYKLALFTLFVLSMQQGQALKCYIYSCHTEDHTCQKNLTDCRTWSESRAKGIVGDLGAMNNNVNGVSGFVCFKTVLKGHGTSAIVEMGYCYPKFIDYCGIVRANIGDHVTFCESCDTDGCNSSSVLAPSAVLFLLVATLVTLVTRQ